MVSNKCSVDAQDYSNPAVESYCGDNYIAVSPLCNFFIFFRLFDWFDLILGVTTLYFLAYDDD